MAKLRRRRWVRLALVGGYVALVLQETLRIHPEATLMRIGLMGALAAAVGWLIANWDDRQGGLANAILATNGTLRVVVLLAVFFLLIDSGAGMYMAFGYGYLVCTVEPLNCE